MAETEEKIKLLKRIAHQFNKFNVTWALGASMMLYLKGIAREFHDIDLMISNDDVGIVRIILSEMGEIKPPNQNPNPMYQTKSFMEFTIDTIDVGVMAGFSIINDAKLFDCSLQKEQIVEKVYPQLLHHVGMIRGEYLLRELNQNILLASCQQFVKDYLDTICSLYSDEEVWYRFSELTNTEANCLEGTKEHFDENHPLFGYRGTRRLLACPDEFQAEAHVVTEVYQTNPNLSVIFPFINDAEQLKQAIRVLREHGFTGKVGTMIELPSAYFDLDRILETGISKIVVGMNDLTSFVFATVRNSQWHDMESPIMLDMLRDMQDKARMKKIDFAVAGYLNASFIQKMNQTGIKCIIHYSSIPEIFNLEIDHPDHLKRIKEVSKKLQRSKL